MQQKLFGLGMLLVLLVAGGSSGVDGARVTKYKDVASFIKRSKEMTQVLKGVTLAGLLPTLSKKNMAATLFLPTDQAFAASAKELNASLDQLFADPVYLKHVLLYHVFTDKAVKAAQVPFGSMELLMANAKNLTVLNNGTMSKPDITLIDFAGRPAHVVTANVKAGKSIIHLIDSVLVPPPIIEPSGGTTSLVDVLKSNNLHILSMVASSLFGVDAVNGLSNTTILAPTDQAFVALIALASQVGNDISGLSPAVKSIFQGVINTHLIPGHLMSADLTDGLVLKSSSNADVVVDLKTKPGSVMFRVASVPSSVATVVQADIMTVNGVVIHRIDKILSNIDLSSIGK